MAIAVTSNPETDVYIHYYYTTLHTLVNNTLSNNEPVLCKLAWRNYDISCSSNLNLFISYEGW